MGCCVSAQNGTTAAPKRHHPVSKSPPRAEEEAVKEVLSETPIPDPNPNPIPNPNPYYYTPIPKITHNSPTNGFPTAILAASNNHRSASPRKQRDITKSPSAVAVATPDEISEVSEISCVSESVSIATADIDGEVRQRVVPRSPSPGRIHKLGSFSTDPVGRRERLTGKSPVRRSDPSPRRIREPTPGQVLMRNRVGGNGFGDGHRRREPGENSGRRSRSPVTRNEGIVSRSNVGRSPSARKTGVSPCRVRMVQPGNGSAGDRKDDEEVREENDPTIPSESLENPLVSLECFIFL